MIYFILGLTFIVKTFRGTQGTVRPSHPGFIIFFPDSLSTRSTWLILTFNSSSSEYLGLKKGFNVFILWAFVQFPTFPTKKVESSCYGFLFSSRLLRPARFSLNQTITNNFRGYIDFSRGFWDTNYHYSIFIKVQCYKSQKRNW